MSSYQWRTPPADGWTDSENNPYDSFRCCHTTYAPWWRSHMTRWRWRSTSKMMTRVPSPTRGTCRTWTSSSWTRSVNRTATEQKAQLQVGGVEPPDSFKVSWYSLYESLELYWREEQLFSKSCSLPCCCHGDEGEVPSRWCSLGFWWLRRLHQMIYIEQDVKLDMCGMDPLSLRGHISVVWEPVECRQL